MLTPMIVRKIGQNSVFQAIKTAAGRCGMLAGVLAACVNAEAASRLVAWKRT